MIALFPKTKQVYLEDNYRSTGAILAASMAIIEEGIRTVPVGYQYLISHR
jgi:superfamily I DNA/RNA helicase